MKRLTNYFALTSFLMIVAFAQWQLWHSAPKKNTQPAWEATSISLRSMSGKTILDLGSFVRRRPDNSVSPEARAFSETGYILRYRLGELPSFIFKAEATALDSLHYRTEMPYLYPSIENKIREELASTVKSLDAYCRVRGAQLLVLPVPVKISIDVPTVRSSELWFQDPNRFEIPAPALVYKTLLSMIGPSAIDLYSLFRSSRELNPVELYLPYDNHWTSYAIALAASLLTEAITRSSPSVIFHAKRPLLHDTFFMDALRLPITFTNASQKFRWQEPLFSVEPAQPNAGRIFLAGTSFSDRLKRSGFGLAELLRKGTGRDVVDVSISGQGKYASIRKLFHRGLSLSPGDVLIWEFPVSQSAAKDGTLPFPTTDKLL